MVVSVSRVLIVPRCASIETCDDPQTLTLLALLLDASDNPLTTPPFTLATGSVNLSER